MNDTEALVSDITYVEPAQPTDEQATAIKQEKDASSIIDHPGWGAIKDAFERRIAALRQMDGIDTTSMPVDQVGWRFLVAKQTADALESFLRDLEAQYAATHGSSEA